MKIVHCCLGSFFNDNYSYQENMLPKYHVRQGHQVVVVASLLSFDHNGKLSLIKSTGSYNSRDGYKVVRIDYAKPFYRINRFFRHYDGLISILNDEKPDIIFIHGIQFYDILKIVKYVKKHPLTIVYADNHADYCNSATNWLSKNILHRIIYRYYAYKSEPYIRKFFGVLPIRCDFLNDVYKLPESKIEYLEMGIDDAQIEGLNIRENRIEIRKNLNILDDDFLIITGGKIDKKKNILLLMHAVANMTEDRVKLLIFGNVNPDIKDSFCKILNNSDRLIHIGWLDSLDINKYIMASDLAVMPGSHSVLWEQIVGCGIPSVFKHFEGMHHVDIGGNCRFLYNDSIEEINTVIKEIIHNKEFYMTMQTAAESEERKRFYYSCIAEKAVSS